MIIKALKKMEALLPVINWVFFISFLISLGVGFSLLSIVLLREVIVGNDSHWVMASLMIFLSIALDYYLCLLIKREILPDLLSQWRIYKNPEFS